MPRLPPASVAARRHAPASRRCRRRPRPAPSACRTPPTPCRPHFFAAVRSMSGGRTTPATSASSTTIGSSMPSTHSVGFGSSTITASKGGNVTVLPSQPDPALQLPRQFRQQRRRPGDDHDPRVARVLQAVAATLFASCLPAERAACAHRLHLAAGLDPHLGIFRPPAHRLAVRLVGVARLLQPQPDGRDPRRLRVQRRRDLPRQLVVVDAEQRPQRHRRPLARRVEAAADEADRRPRRRPRLADAEVGQDQRLQVAPQVAAARAPRGRAPGRN